MNIGIHFSNKQWERPSHVDFERLKLAKPECVKTCLFTELGFDQVDVHKQLRNDFPHALIVARLFASMKGGPWPAHDFANCFRNPIEALKGTVEWFEVHNEPNHDRSEEGFGHAPEQFVEFKNWSIQVLELLRTNHPWAKFVFPGQLVNPAQHVAFWKANLEAICFFDAWGVHCYWQFDNHRHRDWGRCYEVAHELLPDKPIIITEFGDSTNERSPVDKIPFYREWYERANQQPYILGTALYILGGTPDWINAPNIPNFDVTKDMAQAIGYIERQPPGGVSVAGAEVPTPGPSPALPPELPPGMVSNQDVITSFHDIALQVGLGEWELIRRAGLCLGGLAQERQTAYSGPKIDQLPGLTPEQRTLIKADLVRRAGLQSTDEALNFGFGPRQTSGEGFLVNRPELMGAPLSPSVELTISLSQAKSRGERRVATAWNRYGLLLLTIADALDLDPAAVAAVVAAESKRRGLSRDGRLLIRFEPQVFYEKWGRDHARSFDQHFRFDRSRPEQGHAWRPGNSQDWRPGNSQDWRDIHANQESEWGAFSLARTLDDTSAKLSIRMGLVELMGFNYPLLGYQTVDGMFQAFATSERYQLYALFDLIGGEFSDSRRLIALQDGDFESFAALHYGGRQGARYAAVLQDAAEAFKKSSPV